MGADDRATRIFMGVCVLVVIWIGVYWMWEPGEPDRARISVGGDGPVPVSIEGGQDPEIDEDPGPVEIVNTRRPDPIVEEPVSGVIAPEFTSHRVEARETMQDIARARFGDPGLWRAIARANPTVDPLRLREGMILRIPVDPGNIQGVEIGDRDGSSDPAPEPVVEYVVVSGDSLTKIAQDFYGSSRHYLFIYEQNRDVLRSVDDLRVGQVLRLPPLDVDDDG